MFYRPSFLEVGCLELIESLYCNGVLVNLKSRKLMAYHPRTLGVERTFCYSIVINSEKLRMKLNILFRKVVHQYVKFPCLSQLMY